MCKTFLSRGLKPPTQSFPRTALVMILLGMLSLTQSRVAHASVIYVTTTGSKIGGLVGCSLQEAIYSANFDNNVAVDAINSDGSDHFVSTGCVPGSGDDTILLPSRGDLVLSGFVAEDAHNPYGPTATPMVTSNITIEADGALLEHFGTVNFRAFAIASTGSLTIRNAHLKGFTVKGGDGSSGGGGGMGAGGSIYLQTGGLTIENCTFEGNGATGGNGSGPSGGAGGGGGGLSGNGGQSPPLQYQVIVGGGGGGGSRGEGGEGGFFGGGGGGGTVSKGYSPDLNDLTEDGFNCGGAGAYGAGAIGVSAGNDGSCPGGGGGGGAGRSLGILGESGSGAEG